MPVFSKRVVPVLLAGFLSISVVSFNAAKEIIRVDNIAQTALLSKIEEQKPPLIIDVRSPAEYAEGHVPGAINIDFRQIKNRLDEIQQYQKSTVVIYCETGIRARIAESTLLEAGIRARIAESTLLEAGFQSILHLEGHMSAWRSNSLPLEKLSSEFNSN